MDALKILKRFFYNRKASLCIICRRSRQVPAKDFDDRTPRVFAKFILWIGQLHASIYKGSFHLPASV
jgi:hypothetical protein